MATSSPTLKERLKATTMSQRIWAAVLIILGVGLFVAFIVYEREIFQGKKHWYTLTL